GAAKASDCEVSKSFCALARRSFEAYHSLEAPLIDVCSEAETHRLRFGRIASRAFFRLQMYHPRSIAIQSQCICLPSVTSRQVTAVAPKAFGGGVKRYNQRGIRCIAAHAFERKGTLALPGDPVLAGLEGPAESRDEIVGSVRTSENGPSAEVQAHDVGWRFRVVHFGNDT